MTSPEASSITNVVAGLPGPQQHASTRSEGPSSILSQVGDSKIRMEKKINKAVSWNHNKASLTRPHKSSIYSTHLMVEQATYRGLKDGSVNTDAIFDNNFIKEDKQE